MADGKVKVAVLGGGMGAMSAALALTEIDPKGEKYDITVHQLGWRLGGKTASGRNPEYGQRSRSTVFISGREPMTTPSPSCGSRTRR